MMQNATVQTKGEAGQIFRLVGLLGSAWHPSLQSLFGGGGMWGWGGGASFFKKPTQSLPTFLLLILFFLSHFNIPPSAFLFFA